MGRNFKARKSAAGAPRNSTPPMATGCYLMDAARRQVADSVAQLCTTPSFTLAADEVIQAIAFPKDSSHGDLYIPISKLQLPKTKSPVVVAKELSQSFPISGLIAKVTSVGAFLNFTLDKKLARQEIVSSVLAMKEAYGTNQSGRSKTVVIDFSSPNIAKPFHAGHLRSTMIGNFLIHAYRANGWKAVGINYLGDWGKQYGLLAIGFKKYGDEAKLQANPIKHLYDVYVAINKDSEEDPAIDDEARRLFLSMERGDESALQLWRRFRELSITDYKRVYARLGIEFDVYSGESTVESAMAKYVTELENAGLLKDSKGARVIDLCSPGNDLGTAIIVKSDGASNYMTRDIATANERYAAYSFDKQIYVVASQQNLHFQQIFEIFARMGKPWASCCEHVNFGMVLGMSTRKGNVVFLEDIIDDVKDSVHEVMRKNESKYAQIENPEATAETLAISAIVIQDMSANRVKDYKFDRTEMTSLEGDTGPYLQYAHSRLCSIERNSPVTFDLAAQGLAEILAPLTEPIADELVMHLSKFPGVVSDTIRNKEACSVVNYLMTLSHIFSRAFNVLWVKGQPEDVAKARLCLFSAVRVVLANGLRLLGIRPLSRM